jgi:integrase
MSGSVARRPNGQWRARYRDDLGKEHARHFETRKKAQCWLDQVTASKVTGSYVDPNAGKITFADWWREWSQRQVWARGTVLSANVAAKSVTFGDVALGDVKTSHIEQWISTLIKAGQKPSTITLKYVHVNHAFRAAVKDRRIQHNPAEGVTLPRTERREVAMKIPSPERVAKLINAADDEFSIFLALCAFAGLRVGEACAVQVGDIDWIGRKLDIVRQVQYRGAAGTELKAPKDGSARTVPIPDELINILSEQIREHGLADDDWLFSNSPNQAKVTVEWTRTAKRAGVSGFTPHSLRHFHASGLIASGADVVTVQRAMGHSKPTITLNTYSHLWPTAEDRTRSAAAELMTQVINSESKRNQYKDKLLDHG